MPSGRKWVPGSRQSLALRRKASKGDGRNIDTVGVWRAFFCQHLSVILFYLCDLAALREIASRRPCPSSDYPHSTDFYTSLHFSQLPPSFWRTGPNESWGKEK